MSVHFYPKVDQFIECFKREDASTQKNWKADEMESGVTCITLFQLLMTRDTEVGNIFVWCFSLLMWHLMVHNINVDYLTLHIMKRGISDSMSSSMLKQYWTQQASMLRKRMLIPTL